MSTISGSWPMPSGGWTLDLEAEFDILLPWLLSTPEPEVIDRVMRFLERLLEAPDRAHL
jgi:hypothetical protein